MSVSAKAFIHSFMTNLRSCKFHIETIIGKLSASECRRYRLLAVCVCEVARDHGVGEAEVGTDAGLALDQG